MGVWGTKYGKGWCDIDPLTNLCFLLGILTSVRILVKIDQEMRPWEFPQTDRYTHTHHTDANRFYNLSHAICYSYGTDKKDKKEAFHDVFACTVCACVCAYVSVQCNGSCRRVSTAMYVSSLHNHRHLKVSCSTRNLLRVGFTTEMCNKHKQKSIKEALLVLYHANF